MCRNLEVDSNDHWKRRQFWWPRLFIHAKAVQSEQTAIPSLAQPLEEGCSRSALCLSLKHCVGVGDGRRDSDRDSDSSGCVKTEPVAGTFNGSFIGRFNYNILPISKVLQGFSFCRRKVVSLYLILHKFNLMVYIISDLFNTSFQGSIPAFWWHPLAP